MTRGAGYYAMARGWLDHPALDPDLPFCRRLAWIWMVERAVWRTTTFNVRGTLIPLQRGQFSTSVRIMGEAWQWHRSRVERFLGRLKTAQMIEVDAGTAQMVVTICNYSAYQSAGAGAETASETVGETVARQSRDTKEELKERKNVKKDSDPEGLVGRNVSHGIPEHPTGAPGKAMDAWNALAARRGLSAVKFLSPSRRKALAVRLQEAGGLDGWLAALAIVERTPFLLGENERRWKVTFDFLLKQASFARVMEGAYADGPGRSRKLSWHQAVAERRAAATAHRGETIDNE